MSHSRRLTAILAADIAGYSALMSANETGTVADLKGHQAVVLPMIAQFGGRIIDTAGDGLFAEFVSVVNAVECALAIQKTMEERNVAVEPERRMKFRIGLNFGDVIADESRIYGDGVNVAARLEGLAEPGGICVSARVQEETAGRLDIRFEDLGEHRLKNIAGSRRLFRVLTDAPRATMANADAAANHAPMPQSAATVALQSSTLPDVGRKPEPTLPDRPSIAVLPFQNMSGDPEQEYFADGVVEDIITALSRFSSLFVIARNSSFTYKGRAVDVKQVGRELGVRYVLEGSVRKTQDRMRITAQLIDAANGAHLWADRFDGALEDVFDLQDRVTEGVVTAIAPKLEQAEIVRARRKPTESLDAYDYFLRGTESLHLNTQDGTVEALRLFLNAIELDANFAAAYGMAAFCYVARRASRWMTDRAQEIADAERLARRAVQLGADDAVVLARGGHALAYVVEDFDAGKLFVDRALALNPNLAPAWFASGWLRVWIGDPETAIKHTARLMRMSPLDPFLAWMHSATAFAHVFTGRYDLGVAHAELALSEKPNLHQALRAAAVSNALAGRVEQARKATARLRQIDPTLRVSNLKDLTPLQRPEDIAKYNEGMRLAGLPE